MSDINDASVYDDNYTVLSKIRKITRQIKDLITRVTNLENAGGYTLPIASSSRLGGIKVGQNLSIASDGTLSATGGGGGSYVLPPATSETLGGIKVGQNLTIADDGTLSATGGGSSLKGEIVMKEGSSTLSFDNSSPAFIPANLLSGTKKMGHIYFDSIDVKFSGTDNVADTIEIKNKKDDTEIINLNIPTQLNIHGEKLEIFSRYDDTYQTNILCDYSGEPAINVKGNFLITFIDGNSQRWTIHIPDAILYFAWGTINYNLEGVYLTGVIDHIYNVATRKNYITTESSHLLDLNGNSEDTGTIISIPWFGPVVE